MRHITIDETAAKTLADETGPVGICDRHGNYLGYVVKGEFTPEEIAVAETRANSAGPWLTTQQVMDHLRSLESA